MASAPDTASPPETPPASVPELTPEFILGLEPEEPDTAAPSDSPGPPQPPAETPDTATGVVKLGEQEHTVSKDLADHVAALRAMQSSHDQLSAQNALLTRQLQQINTQPQQSQPSTPAQPSTPPPPPVDVAQLNKDIESIESDIGSGKGTLQHVLNSVAKLSQHQALEDFKKVYYEPLQQELNSLKSTLDNVSGTVATSQESADTAALMRQYGIQGDPQPILSAASRIQQGWVNSGIDPATANAHRGEAILQGIIETLTGSNGATSQTPPSTTTPPPSPPGPSAQPPRPNRNVSAAPPASPTVDINTMLADKLGKGDLSPVRWQQ